MKRILALLLTLLVLLSLCACGETEEAKAEEQPEETPSPAALVEEQIYALGVIGLDSKDAIESAEDAYAALSPAEQAEVRNVAILQAARLVYDDAAEAQAAAEAEAAREAAMAPFVGTWVAECPVSEPDPFELREDGYYHKDAYTGTWSADPDAGTLNIDGTQWIVFEEDGFIKIRKDEEYSHVSDVRILAGNRDAAAAIKFLVVDFSEESILDYVGQPVRAGNWLKWGNVGGADYVYPSLVYDQGLIFYAISSDFRYECRDSSVLGVCPYQNSVSYQLSGQLSGNAQGRFCYIRAEYVEDYRFEQVDGYDYRVIGLTSGVAILEDFGSGPVDYDRMDYPY